MSYSSYQNVGLFFHPKQNDEKLIRQVMECYELEESDFLYHDDSPGAVGPQFYDSYESKLYYNCDALDADFLFDILNTLFDNIAVYAVMDEYCFGTEDSYDPVSRKQYCSSFTYFDFQADDADIRSSESEIDFLSVDDDYDVVEVVVSALNELLLDAEKNNFTELCDLITVKRKPFLDKMAQKCS